MRFLMALMLLAMKPIRAFKASMSGSRTRAFGGSISIRPSILGNIDIETTAIRPKVVLARGKSRLFRDGEMIVYSGAVSHVEGVGKEKIQMGSFVEVTDGAGSLIGVGTFNPDSMFRVRLLWLNNTGRVTEDLSLSGLLHLRIRIAVSKRIRMGLPNVQTNAFRLVNSEGDHLSGLIVDVFGTTAVIQSGAVWCEKHRS